MSSNARQGGDFRFCWRILRQARPYWPHLAVICLLALLAAPLALATPLPIMMAVDNVLGGKPFPWFMQAVLPASLLQSAGSRLAVVAGFAVAVALLTQLQGFASWVLQLYVGEKLVLDFRSRLFGHAQRLSVAYHDERGVADALYRIQYDTSAMQYVTMKGLLPLVTSAVTVIALLWVTARMDGQLALIAVAISPMLLGLAELYRHRIRSRWSGIKQLESATMGVVQEVLGALRVVKAFGQEERERERFVRSAGGSLWAQIHVVLLETAFGMGVALLVALGTAAVLIVGVWRVQAGVLTVGQLLVVLAYVTQLYQPLATISRTMTDIQSALASAERAFLLLDQGVDVVERPHAHRVQRARGEIVFEGVSFSYSAGRGVLRDLSLRVGAGASVGLSGATGAGKTTLVSLLPRFQDPTAGSILLDGVDLRDYRLADLRSQFAIVLQEPVLFSTSIAENIAYGRPGATTAEIEAAARAANLHDDIVRLPEGYGTCVGDRGSSLSGGERQRVALARAFLRDAPILILDEPTSSVDVQSEAAIMEAMQRLMQGRTTFLIAHRPSTLDYCSMRLHLSGGILQPAAHGALAPASRQSVAG